MYRLLELYCGVGGMRFALDAAGIQYEVVAAIDIDPVVSAIYKHNFGSQGHYERNILSLTSSDIENMNIDIITMSPPSLAFQCFDENERVVNERSKSFLHLLTILNKLQRKPLYIFLENGLGFNICEARKVLIQTLKNLGYRYQEFCMTPNTFAIPNSRYRHYVIAKLREEQFSFIESDQQLMEMPNSSNYRLERPDWEENNILAYPLKHFLETEAENLERYRVSDRILEKYLCYLDPVSKNSRNSSRFTKGYHRFAIRSGPVLSSIESYQAFSHIRRASSCRNRALKLTILKEIGFRYFTPREIANLLFYPPHFSFPPEITVEQMYESLGNSMNVYVVSCLMKLLFEK